MSSRHLKKEKKQLVLILILGFIIRITAALHFQSESIALSYFGYDESVYYSMARHMAKSSVLTYTLKDSTLYFQDYFIWYLDKPLFHHPPLYVWMLHLWQQVFGTSVLVSRLLNVLLGSLTIYIAYLIGSRFSERTGLISALFVSMSPIHVQQSGLILTDALLSALTALFILSCIRLSENNTRFNQILCSLALGLSLWSKYFGVLALSFLIVYTIHGRISTVVAARVIAFALVVFSLWLIWNYDVYGFFIPVETWKTLASWSQLNVPSYSYVVFLPIVAPFSLLGYAALFRLKRDPLKLGLAAVFLSFLLIFTIPSAKEMRFILPALLPLSVLAAEFTESIQSSYKKPLLILAVLATAISAFVIVGGSYHWYLPFWHYTGLFGF
jgi:4-amino-4-deoxy-L-arabinose transferase-like glycosyltransferase